MLTRALKSVNLRDICASGSGLPKEPGRFLRGGGVDEKAAPPLEPRNLGELRDDFQMPVVVVRGRGAQGGRAEHEVERRIRQNPVHTPDKVGDHYGQGPDFLGPDLVVRRAVRWGGSTSRTGTAGRRAPAR